MVTPETNQSRYTLIWPNIVNMSLYNDIPVKIEMEGGSKHEGIIKRGWISFPGGTECLYLRPAGSGDSEQHTLLNFDKIVSLSFVTEKGFLDNLLEWEKA